MPRLNGCISSTPSDCSNWSEIPLLPSFTNCTKMDWMVWPWELDSAKRHSGKLGAVHKICTRLY